ncbi:interleukin-5 receptor subunit alpha isoform X2 [Ochotona princeps]|uniref:interleukin-5 receptor subunit alpha isoform X2 n=1 Tax=Ochotona princeps TaxID=9978 RepID=UPI002714A55B|nr:interleukin-5 receptor subunit alpha isoform X2 [Ochotona princeps]
MACTQDLTLAAMAPALLILLGTVAVSQADALPDETLLLLPPVNFTIQAAGLAQVLLRWQPPPDGAGANLDLEYHVRMHTPQEDEYETRSTESRQATPLHRGVSASVRTILRRDSHSLLAASRWVSARLEAPPGTPGTAAVNLTCTTNTAVGNDTPSASYWVSLRCAWLVGEAAPQDTQYFLYYRFGSQTEECWKYSRDALQRNIACWFPKTAIRSKRPDPLAVYVNGSSKFMAIQPFDQLFALHAIDQVNPPQNVSTEVAGLEGTRVSIQWEKPVSAFPAHCFHYQVKINNTRRGSAQTEHSTTNGFTSVIDNSSRYCVEVRATVSAACRAASLWSAWSPPSCVGHDKPRPSPEQLLLVLPATVCLVLLICSFVCKICHLWTRVFPPVPTPSRSLGNLEAMSYETASQDAESEVIMYVEELGPEMLEHPVF